MLVYRVETREGTGAFNADLARTHDKHVPDRGKRAYDMPTPMGEPDHTPLHQFHMQHSYDKDHLFAFSSKTQLKRAFRYRNGRAAMDRRGGQVSVYEVPATAVLKGQSQVVFRRSAARLVSILTCADLEPKLEA